MQMRRLSGYFCLLGAILGSMCEATLSVQPTTSSAPSSQAVVLAELAPVRIGEKPLTESALAALVARLAAQRVEAARAGDPAAAVGAAEFILVRQIEPALSRELLEMASDADRRFVQQRTAVAGELLDSASKKLADADDDDAVEPLRERIALARVYIALFQAIMTPPQPATSETTTSPSANERDDRILAACRGLATYLDSPQPAVASSARFWQSVGYRRAGRPDRTLQVLARATAPPQMLPHDFFARVERCRALADREQLISASAMLLEIGRRIDDWLPGPDRDPAQSVVRTLRAGILDAWAAKLASPQRADGVGEMRKEADELRRDASNFGHPIRLEIAIAGIEAPLTPLREPAAILGISCDKPHVAIVVAPGGATDDAWNDARRAVSALVKQFEGPQSFALVAPRGEKVRAFPESDWASGGGEDAARAEQFVGRLQSAPVDVKRVSESLARALELRPDMVLLVAAADLEPSFVPDLRKLLTENHVVLNVVWIGADGGGALEELARESGGVLRRMATTTRADDREAPEETPAP